MYTRFAFVCLCFCVCTNIHALMCGGTLTIIRYLHEDNRTQTKEIGDGLEIPDIISSKEEETF